MTPEPMSPAQTRFLRRLRMTRTLLPQDQAYLDRATRIYEWRREGLSFQRIADKEGKTYKSTYKFATSPTYAACVQFLEARAEGRALEAADVPALMGSHREVLRSFVPKALQRLELSLESGVDLSDGAPRLLESKAADRAMEVVLDANGLLESEAATRPQITIQTLVIQQLTDTILSDEARARAARPVQIEAP